MKTIGIVTGTRAEYHLLHPLIMRILSSDVLSLQMYVTGSHLNESYGATYKDIEKDGITIDFKIPILDGTNNDSNTNTVMSKALLGFDEVFRMGKPDLIVLLGDRYELLCAAIVAMNLQIPIAHISGGDTTEGAIDECIRHSITKMSYLHFPSCEKYRRRVIQLGENPDRVFNVGGLGIENILNVETLSRNELSKEVGLDISDSPFAVVTFHPVTLEGADSVKEEVEALLSALDKFQDMKVIFTKSNADKGGLLVNKMVDEYAENNAGRCVSFFSLGMKRYLSALKYADLMIGNSSSGILESPSFQLPTVNIGDRQKGRLQAANILNCAPIEEEIEYAIKIARSDSFKGKMKMVKSPYGDGNVSQRIVDHIIDFFSSGWNPKKKFYDIT